ELTVLELQGFRVLIGHNLEHEPVGRTATLAPSVAPVKRIAFVHERLTWFIAGQSIGAQTGEISRRHRGGPAVYEPAFGQRRAETMHRQDRNAVENPEARAEG